MQLSGCGSPATMPSRHSEAEEEAEGDLADAVALGVVEAADRVGPQPVDVLGHQHAARGEVRCARAAAARADGRGSVARAGADAGPRPRSRARRRSARGSRPARAPASSPGARRLRIGPTRPRLRRSASTASATPACCTLTATSSPSVVRARWTWPSDAMANGSSSKSSNSSPRGRRGPARSPCFTRLKGTARAPPGSAPSAGSPLAVELEHREELRELRSGALQPAELRSELLGQRERRARRSRASQPPAPTAAQQLAPAVGVDLRRLARLHEVDQHPDEAQRIVEVREVARVGEDLEPAARDEPWAARACSTGMIGSRSPQTSRNGIAWAR